MPDKYEFLTNYFKPFEALNVDQYLKPIKIHASSTHGRREALKWLKWLFERLFEQKKPVLWFQTVDHGDGNYEFICQHGPAECYGNKLHACAIDELQNITLAVLYNSCLMDYSQPGNGSNDAAADVVSAFFYTEYIGNSFFMIMYNKCIKSLIGYMSNSLFNLLERLFQKL